jgi:hypothetical protein
MSTENFKAQAARLVKYLSEHHRFRLKQSSSLEAIAAVHGMRNWNTLINCLPPSENATAESPSIRDSYPNGLSSAVSPSPDVRTNEPNAWPELEETGLVQSAVVTPGDADVLVARRVERLVNHVVPFLADSTRHIQRCGWRKDNRLYLLEIRFREFIFAHFSDSVQRSLREIPRQGLHLVTQSFLRALNARGWLVTEEGGYQVEVEKALWNLKIGTLPWKGVIVLELPASMSESVDVADTRHEVRFEGPLFARQSTPVQSLVEQIPGAFTKNKSRLKRNLL